MSVNTMPGVSPKVIQRAQSPATKDSQASRSNLASVANCLDRKRYRPPAPRAASKILRWMSVIFNLQIAASAWVHHIHQRAQR